MGSPFEGSPRAGVAEYVKGGCYIWGMFLQNQQIDKSTNRPIISQTQAYSLPKIFLKTHTHQR